MDEVALELLLYLPGEGHATALGVGLVPFCSQLSLFWPGVTEVCTSAVVQKSPEVPHMP